ncbi:hypothetical protein AgCh_032207 [Apium graveolens]
MKKCRTDETRRSRSNMKKKKESNQIIIAARLERAKFPTLAAVAQTLKQEQMKQRSVKNFVGIRGKQSNLVKDLVEKHKRSLQLRQPNSLDHLVQNVCTPAGLTKTDLDDDDAEEEERLHN